jgi:hypothetical protein
MAYKKVRQLTLTSKFIKEFDSMRLASDELNIDYFSISKCCNLHCDQAKGYKFEFTELKKDNYE